MSAAATYKCVIKSAAGTSEHKYTPIKIKEKFEYERYKSDQHDSSHGFDTNESVCDPLNENEKTCDVLGKQVGEEPVEKDSSLVSSNDVVDKTVITNTEEQNISEASKHIEGDEGVIGESEESILEVPRDIVEERLVENAPERSKEIVKEELVSSIEDQVMCEEVKDVIDGTVLNTSDESPEYIVEDSSSKPAMKSEDTSQAREALTGTTLQLKENYEKTEIPKEEVDDGIPFVVKEKMKPFEATCDEKATVSVQLSKPAREFKWFFNNKEVTPDNENFTMEDNGKGLYSFSFVQCSMSDDKKPVKYVAKHATRQKELTDSIRMKVKPAKLELFTNTKIKDLYDLGEEIELALRVKGHKEPYSVNWAKGFRKVTEEEGKCEMKIEGDCIKLFLKNIEPADAGIYKCTVKSSAGTSELKFSPIKVKKPPVETKAEKGEEFKGLKKAGPNEKKDSQSDLGNKKLRKTSRNEVKKEDVFEVKDKLKPAVVESGDAAKFSVNFSKKAESFVWYFDDKDITEDSEEFTTFCNAENTSYSMSIKTCFLEQDKSKIKFVAVCEGVELTNTVKLKVRPAAPGLKPLGETKEVYCVGEDATFALMINGHQEPFEVTWFKGFKKIEGVEVETSPTRTTMYLKNVDMSAAATYKCVIKSAAGTSEYKYAPIKIKEKFEYERYEGSQHDDPKAKTRSAKPSGSVSQDVSAAVGDKETSIISEEEIAANEEARLLEMSRRASFDSWASGDESDGLNRFRRTKMSELEGVLQVVEKLKAKVVEEDDEAVFKVVLSENVDSIKWFINKVEVASNCMRFTTISEEKWHMLIIRDCTLADNKSSIRFQAALGEEEVFGAVRLKVQPATTKLKLKSRTLEEYLTGDEIPFELYIRGHPEPFTITWSKGFRGVSHEEGRTEITIQPKEVSLLVKEAELSDAGIYKCVIKSSAGLSEYKYEAIKMKVNPGRVSVQDKEPFEIQEKMKPVVAECGDPAEFSVTFASTPDQVKWLMEDVEIDMNSRAYTVKKDEVTNKYTFTILRCSMAENKKSIKYVATRNSRELISSVRLKVQPAMPGLKQVSHLKETYEEEEEIKLVVDVKGHTDEYTVQWFKGFKEVNINDGLYGFVRDNNNRVSFIIRKCQKPDAGSYKLVVKSSVTTSELKFEPFKVKGLITTITYIILDHFYCHFA